MPSWAQSLTSLTFTFNSVAHSEGERGGTRIALRSLEDTEDWSIKWSPDRPPADQQVGTPKSRDVSPHLVVSGLSLLALGSSVRA
jgi:hypothetical protein